ncbi:MAG: 3'-5' exonuclease [Betaproteobacteria bacterium]|nr:3'-5' exonuclease [Betaproteobacteria bacterium]
MGLQVAAFDIETVPDPELLRRCYQDDNASDDELIERAEDEAIEKTGSNMLPIQFHKIACISLLYRDSGKDIFRISSKRPPEHSEKDALEAFFLLIDRHSPQLVSWNGSGFDLPVMHLRAMQHRVVCETYWRGPGNRYEQYTSRYSDHHLDLMDKLALYQPRCYARLETAALACGLPGKMGTNGSAVHEMWKAGKYKQIADYCETDVLNTYLLWLRFMMISGAITPDEHDGECEAIASQLTSSQAEHLIDFHARWIGGNS